MSASSRDRVYSIIIAVHPSERDLIDASTEVATDPHPVGDITVDWVDFTREKSLDQPLSPTQPTGDMPSGSAPGPSKRDVPGSSKPTSIAAPRRRAPPQDPSELSLQPLLGHLPGHGHGPHPLETSVASGVTAVGRGVIHLFRHAPPASLIASLDAHPVGESSKAALKAAAARKEADDWAGQRAEGEDGSLVAILAVPAWMRPADFLEFIGGWGTCLEGVRMIREATTPNRSIVLLKFRDPLQASDFLVIFTGRAFSTLDPRETCHPIRIHHLVLHKLDARSSTSIAVPAFPPSVYGSRAKALKELLPGVDVETLYELPSCPVCLERLDSSVTGLVTLPCAHSFDCECLRKWGDSRCPVCRVSHLLLSSHAGTGGGSGSGAGPGRIGREEVTRVTRCAACDATEQNWICVVCGVVGCGRYEPGKGHARRHWEESGHVLAMELETQRVWDYKGDNYVHRLIQTRTDGKLVELPSASSLITPSHSHISRPLPLGGTHSNPQTPTRPRPSAPNTGPASRPYTHTPSDSLDLTPHHAGPSSGDEDKMSTIEAITLEYSYLLSSQLEAMRQHYETRESARDVERAELESAREALRAAQAASGEGEVARERAERKASKAADLSRGLARELQAEKAMAQGLAERVKVLQERLEGREREVKGKEEEVKGLEETVRDLMFSLEAGARIAEAGGVEAGEGGDLVVRQSEAVAKEGKGGKKKGKR